MNSDKAAYLAAHYLTVEKTGKSKKRKRKDKSQANDGLLIKEDDEFGWSVSNTKDAQDSDDDLPTTVAGHSAEFRRTKKSSWKTISAPIPTDTRDEAAAAADAILAQVAAEKAAAAREADGEDADIPMLDAPPDTEVIKMRDGTHAGLQSAKALSAQLAKRQREERKELEQMKAERAAKGDDGEPEFILRDATGRRVDISMKKAELRRAEKEALEKEEAKKRALKGEVQLEEARRKRELLEDAKLMPLARGKDDEELNRELKAQERWNDPMAQFLEDTGGGGGGAGSAGKGGKSSSNKRRPVYKGPAPPNRYGIRPGYRWDGVDRGTGFEAERFKALNRRERNKGLEYSWQMDV